MNSSNGGETSGTESSPTHARILVVDDDRTTCMILAKILSLRGYRVDTACNGENALALARENDYGLALLDYRMPGMNGIELYQRMREIQPEVVGVFLTGFPTIDTVFPAIGAGVERVLAKPADSSELFEVVEHFLGKPS